MDALTDIAVFVRVVERGSFTLAADELELSRAVVSKYLSRLEERLGARLLHRTTRRLSLTEAGAALFEASRGAIERIDEAEAAVARFQSAPRGRLRVSAPMSFGILHLAPALAEFAREHEAIAIDLRLDDRFVDLVEEGFDIAIRIGKLADSSLVARWLATTHECLIYTYSSTANVWRFAARDGREIPVAVSGSLRANNGIALSQAAIAGHGVLMSPTFYVGAEIRAGRLKAILEAYRLPELGIYAVYPQSRHVAPKVRAFVDFLAKRFRRRF